MPTTFENCRQQVKSLSLHERSLLIKDLIDELDELELEHLWIKEASRRFKEFKAGKIKARPGADVFNDARAKLEEIR